MTTTTMAMGDGNDDGDGAVDDKIDDDDAVWRNA
jgi:hypothetical protein